MGIIGKIINLKEKKKENWKSIFGKQPNRNQTVEN